jgi:hypothetical protein
MKAKIITGLWMAIVFFLGAATALCYGYWQQSQEIEKDEYVILAVVAIQNPFVDKLVKVAIQDGTLTRGEFEAIVKFVNHDKEVPSPAEAFWGTD